MASMWLCREKQSLEDLVQAVKQREMLYLQFKQIPIWYYKEHYTDKDEQVSVASISEHINHEEAALHHTHKTKRGVITWNTAQLIIIYAYIR